jgi:hypothetical protein
MRWILWLLGAAATHAVAAEGADRDPLDESTLQFAGEVDRRLEVPQVDQARYLESLERALAAAGVPDLSTQHLLLVDRSPNVQAIFVVLRTPAGAWRWVGASPASTGRVGSFDHFETPTGVFTHGLENPDFRAEGTINENGIRGYGARGMRIFDFGWVMGERGWGGGGLGEMRLQMHATDPVLLEPRLGQAASKGCIRIPATLNTYLDRHAILDADYEHALARGAALWMIRADRKPTAWPGRYLVVVDSQASARPAWASPPSNRPAARARSDASLAAAPAQPGTGPC